MTTRMGGAGTAVGSGRSVRPAAAARPGATRQGGAIVTRPTVTGPRFCCERLAQSSSSNSRGTTRAASFWAMASPARSRASGVVKKMVMPPSCSCAADGQKSCAIASASSESTSRTSSAGYRNSLPSNRRGQSQKIRRIVKFLDKSPDPGLLKMKSSNHEFLCPPENSERHPNMSLTRSNKFRSSCSLLWVRGSKRSLGKAAASCSRRRRCSFVIFFGV